MPLSRVVFVVATVLLLFVGGELSNAQQPELRCFIDLPVYGPLGERLPFSIEGVRSREPGNRPNLLQHPTLSHRLAAAGSRLKLDPLLVRREIHVTLVSKAGDRVSAEIVLFACACRRSLRFGVAHSGADVAWSTITGRLTGCTLRGDWWIRAMPMFGGNRPEWIHEGLIRTEDGSFALDGSMHGERFIVVIGKDRQPIRAVGINVVEGGRNQIGTVDLSGNCPE